MIFKKGIINLFGANVAELMKPQDPDRIMVKPIKRSRSQDKFTINETKIRITPKTLQVQSNTQLIKM